MTANPPPQPAQYPEASQATTALVLSILGIVLCWVLPPVAWVIASSELKGIADGRRDPSGRGMANAAKVIGIVGTVLLIVGVGLFLLLFIAGATSSEFQDTFDDIANVLDT